MYKRQAQRIRMMRTHASYEVDRVGVFTPKLLEAAELGPGAVSYTHLDVYKRQPV